MSCKTRKVFTNTLANFWRHCDVMTSTFFRAINTCVFNVCNQDTHIRWSKHSLIFWIWCFHVFPPISSGCLHDISSIPALFVVLIMPCAVGRAFKLWSRGLSESCLLYPNVRLCLKKLFVCLQTDLQSDLHILNETWEIKCSILVLDNTSCLNRLGSALILRRTFLK